MTICNDALQLLEANAARLTPEHKQRCKSDWGIEHGPYEVSFLAPVANEALWEMSKGQVPSQKLDKPIVAHLPDSESKAAARSK